jgi:hypothetical protein
VLPEIDDLVSKVIKFKYLSVLPRWKLVPGGVAQRNAN